MTPDLRNAARRAICMDRRLEVQYQMSTKTTVQGFMFSASPQNLSVLHKAPVLLGFALHCLGRHAGNQQYRSFVIMEQAEFAQQVLATVKQLEDEIERLQLQIKRTKETIQTTAIRGLRETDGAIRQDLLWELYWKHNETVSSTALATFLRVHVNAVRSKAGNAYLYLTCKECGTKFHAPISSRAEYKGVIAGYQRENDYRQKRCPECEAQKQRSQQQSDQAYWDQVRQREDRIQELRVMPYYEYLHTPEWKAIREYKLRRARYRCELCFADSRLNVHHKTYERRGHEDDRDLIVLCENCHAKFHDKLIEE